MTSGVALAVLASAEDKAPLQPLNATSHWLYGDRAAKVRGTSLDHTTVGMVTHHAATIFWALFFETSLAVRPVKGAAALAGRAAQIATLAAIVDYTVTPKRFTPGWELVLSKRAMAMAYAAIAVGFALPHLASPLKRSHKQALCRDQAVRSNKSAIYWQT